MRWVTTVISEDKAHILQHVIFSKGSDRERSGRDIKELIPLAWNEAGIHHHLESRGTYLLLC